MCCRAKSACSRRGERTGSWPPTSSHRFMQPSSGGSAPERCCCWWVARGRLDFLRVVSATVLLAVSLFGLAWSANDTSVGGAYAAFTCTILLWGAQEIAFLSGWVTGPAAVSAARPALARICETPWRRRWRAILYHELTLLVACGAADRRVDLGLDRFKPGRACGPSRLSGCCGKAPRSICFCRRARHQ